MTPGASLADPDPVMAKPEDATRIRVAVFNIWELSLDKLDQVDAMGRGNFPQLQNAAAVIQHVRPDILLLNEIDYNAERSTARLFIERYLRHPQDGGEAIDYAHVVQEPVNTGVPSALDLNNDGDTEDPEDSWGFGRYPGQYGMALLSRYPVDRAALRSFRGLRWITMPGHLIPDGREGRPEWYTAEAAGLLRLSSKSHWDVPVAIGDRVLHVLASHPTPGGFDGEEDRNGRRNHDEIRLWSDYLSGDPASRYIVDDAGQRGGLDDAAAFVVMGDLNADPVNDPGDHGKPAIRWLLDHPRILDTEPRSAGRLESKRIYGGESETRTSAYGRIDYVLPSRNLTVADGGVFLPPQGDRGRRWLEGDKRASDHLLVWLDIDISTAAISTAAISTGATNTVTKQVSTSPPDS